MREKPHAAILNRDQPIEAVRKHLSAQVELLRDLANYGSNLVMRAFDSSPKRWTEVVTCGVLTKQITAMVDATEVLLSAGCGHAAFLPARTAFEAGLYQDWIFHANSEHRATCYIVGTYRDKRAWAKRITPGTAEAAEFQAVANDFQLDVHKDRPTLQAEVAAQLVDLDRVLSTPTMSAINALYDKLRRRRRHDAEWYELDGAKSIRDIATQVGRVHEYDYFYSRGSTIAHTGSYADHLHFADGQVRMKPVRHVADVYALINFIVFTALRSFRVLLLRYRPGEVNAFTKKYQEDWRNAAMNVPKINYDW
jgi:Family of unknown function (DUF5677)